MVALSAHLKMRGSRKLYGTFSGKEPYNQSTPAPCIGPPRRKEKSLFSYTESRAEHSQPGTGFLAGGRRPPRAVWRDRHHEGTFFTPAGRSIRFSEAY